MGLSKRQSGWQRTKIVCTLGPSTDAPGVIERLIAAGMDVARINTSHSDHAEHAGRIRHVRLAGEEAGQPVAILVDLPGPKFRVGEVPDGCLKLKEKESVALMPEGEQGGPGVSQDESGYCLPVRDPELLAALAPGERVFLADGTIELLVETVGPQRAVCRVLIGGPVRSGSGINLPESSLDALVPTEEDRRHLAFAIAQKAEWVGVSFVQTAADILRVRALLPDREQPLLMAKIEKRRALGNLDEIVEASDGVMVARGDLGIETDLAEIPIVQKRIIAVANAKGRPVVTATQMLESMVEHEHPTRAEVTDVANAALDGTDAVMLSAETAIGRFPALAAGMLARVLAATEALGDGGKGRAGRAESGSTGNTLDKGLNDRSYDILNNRLDNGLDNPLAHTACRLAAGLGACAIIAPVRTMMEAMNIGRFRPPIPIVAITESPRLYASLALVRGIAPQIASAVQGEHGETISAAREWLFARGLAKQGDCGVLLYASVGEEADSLQAVRL